ncbi:MAG: glycosyltransferase family 2 protein [Candidatus Omnitrophica bacterium]|nr:glycosyltransferase family 2 protein [Candidatus Omnitrophota bacterium]
MSATEKAKVSVIIPAYNRAHTLMPAVKSAIDQHYDNMEIIIVDDCSSDNTKDVVAGIADKRIKYLRRAKNGGVAAARNDGIRAASGDYIAFLDSDDAWMPGKIEAQLKAFAENESAGLVFVNAYETAADGAARSFIDRPEPSRVVYGSKDRAAGIFPGSIMVAPPTGWMIKKAAIDKTGFFDENMSVWEDCDYLARLAARFDIYFVNVPLIVIAAGGSDHLSRNMLSWHEGKKIFYAKHALSMDRDKRHLFRFYKGMAKDCFILKDRDNAAKWIKKALRLNPFALDLYFKLLRLYPSPSHQRSS